MLKLLRKRKLNKLGIYIDSVDQLNKGLDLEVESPCYLNGARLSTFDGEMKRIGAYSYFRSDIRIASFASIGRYCSVARGVRIGDENHHLDWVSTHPFVVNPRYTGASKEHFQYEKASTVVKPTVIGHDVWIAQNAIILGGVNVGHGAVIGAGAVVTKDVPPYAVVGGVPAKIIKYRFPEPIRHKLLEIQWWNYDPKELVTLDCSEAASFITSFENANFKPFQPPVVRIKHRAKSISMN